MKITIPSHFRFPRRRSGFSLLELLIVIAAISSVAAMGFVYATNTTESVKTAKLRQDVAALNRALRTYVISGGDLSTVSNGTDVIAKLKTTTSSSQRASVAGLRGSMIDRRLRGVTAGANDTSRAVWDDAKKTFVVQTSGTGFREFLLDVEPAAAPVQETRKVMMAMTTSDKWIWGFNDQGASAGGPRSQTSTTDAPVITPITDSSLMVLQSPDFSKPGALYDYSAFNPDMKVSLVDRNAANTADIFYAIADGPWQRWTGTPLSIPRELTTQVKTYSAPLDPDRYEASAVAQATYETIFFRGSSSGFFSNPVGATTNFVTNLVGGLTGNLFTFGKQDSLLGLLSASNRLEFTGKSFDNIAPEQLFEVGTLSYYNGTVIAGTSASKVDLNFNLTFRIPENAPPQVLPFTFSLLSTPNTKPDKLKDPQNVKSEKQLDDDDADYVYIPNVSTPFNTVIKGKRFYLVLSFGSNNGNGFTTINEFHAHENKTLTGSIYGRFTTQPPAP